MSDTQIYEPDKSGSRSFGKYKVIKELGRGAMGVVYQCFDPDFERTVAVKILSPELLDLDASGEYRQRFKNEMRAAGRLSHPNVINVYDAGEQEGVPYFVMEYVDGIELKQALDDGERFELSRTLQLMRDILSGLKYIHSHGITHRDLKPANIFITRDGAAKITDFGIAKLESSELTRVGTIIGSPRYMSPEQCQGLPVDARSDLFAAGIIFYQLLTNEHCFDANSPTAIMQKIIHGKPEAPSVLIPTLPKPYDDVVFRALQKTQDGRYQSAEAFLEDLEAAAAGKRVSAKPGSYKLIGAVAGVVLGGLAAAVILPYALERSSSPEVLEEQGGNTPSEVAGKAAEQASGNATTQSETAGGVDHSGTKESSEGQNTAATDSGAGALTESTNRDQQLDAKVDKLLRVAKVHQMQGRLVTPSGSSAYDAYRIVLDIDPGNTRAIAGMETLEQNLVQKIKELRQAGSEDIARTQAVAGAKLFPENQELGALARK